MISARQSLFATQAGHGPPFVLLHGGHGSWTHWQRNIAALARHFRVIALDLPGYGDSPDPPAGITDEAYLAWVIDAVRDLAPGTFHLAGFSFGSSVAAAVALARGGDIGRLSLLGVAGLGRPVGRSIPMAKLPGPDSDPVERRRVAAANLGVWMLARAPAPDDPVVEQQLRDIDRTCFDSRRISLGTIVLDRIAEISADIQLIWGRCDVLAHPSIEDRAARLLAIRPGLRVDIVADAGHWVQYEQAAQVTRLLLDFHLQGIQR